ncbi:uncharacterized protein LOC128096284 [Peromyscus californicus insignis]|uniref:uncharacterized protein LOC128096284 n=1 Tax=Peromyscus californicus insignis TaxID=564181 RepID=UPI0022A74BFB|nr:uncharacterized protein LOC128096284 [Peromyscus californicus insignis]
MVYNTKINYRCAYPDTENSGHCHVEKKKLNYPVLCPYKNGFVKSSTWNTNLESHDCGLPFCLRNHGNSGSNHSVTDFALLDILEDSTSSTSEELLDSPISDEQETMSPTWHPSNVHHMGDFSEEYYVARSALPLQTVNSDANGVGDLSKCSTEDMAPSSIEGPKENYVDTMDELQCLVETVSEYLAEKEEEINRFGSLSKTRKPHEHNIAVDNAERKTPENQTSPLAVTQNAKAKAVVSFPELNGVKCAVGSLFSSLTEKVGSGTKHLTTSVEKTGSFSSRENRNS